MLLWQKNFSPNISVSILFCFGCGHLKKMKHILKANSLKTGIYYEQIQ